MKAFRAGLTGALLAGIIAAGAAYADRDEFQPGDFEARMNDFRFTLVEAFTYPFFYAASGIEDGEPGWILWPSLFAIGGGLADTLDFATSPDLVNLPGDALEQRLGRNFGMVILEAIVMAGSYSFLQRVRGYFTGAPPALVAELLSQGRRAFPALADAVRTVDMDFLQFTWDLLWGAAKEGIGRAAPPE